MNSIVYCNHCTRQANPRFGTCCGACSSSKGDTYKHTDQCNKNNPGVDNSNMCRRGCDRRVTHNGCCCEGCCLNGTDCHTDECERKFQEQQMPEIQSNNCEQKSSVQQAQKSQSKASVLYGYNQTKNQGNLSDHPPQIVENIGGNGVDVIFWNVLNKAFHKFWKHLLACGVDLEKMTVPMRESLIIERIIGLSKDYPHAVICLQEVSKDVLAGLQGKLGSTYEFVISRNAVDSQVTIWSKTHPVLGSKQCFKKTYRFVGNNANGYKHILCTNFPDEICIINTHVPSGHMGELKSFIDNESWVNRIKHTKIICGDFNCTNVGTLGGTILSSGEKTNVSAGDLKTPIAIDHLVKL